MKQLYKNDKRTEEVFIIEQALEERIYALFVEYRHKDYSIREVGMVLHNMIFDIELDHRLDLELQKPKNMQPEQENKGEPK